MCSHWSNHLQHTAISTFSATDHIFRDTLGIFIFITQTKTTYSHRFGNFLEKSMCIQTFNWGKIRTFFSWVVVVVDDVRRLLEGLVDDDERRSAEPLATICNCSIRSFEYKLKFNWFFSMKKKQIGQYDRRRRRMMKYDSSINQNNALHNWGLSWKPSCCATTSIQLLFKI